MKSTVFLHSIVFLISLAIAPIATADRININLTASGSTPTGTGADGTAALGGGSWNRINGDEAAGVNALVKSSGAASSATATNGGAVGSAALSVGNPVMNESWGDPVTLTIAGLLPGQTYKVVVYSDRFGTGVSNTDLFSVVGTAGEIKSLFMPGNPGTTLLPGTENVDYLTFIATSSATGTLDIGGPYITGVQIEGLLDATEKGPQMDCRIAKTGAGTGGKGNGLYSINSSRSQSLTQRTIGRRAKRYYVNIENDGGEVDNCYAMAFLKRKQAKIKVIDRDGGGNVTADALARNHRYVLCKGDTRRFKVVIKPSSRKRATINVQLCGSPSTLIRNKQDCVTCVLKVKN